MIFSNVLKYLFKKQIKKLVVTSFKQEFKDNKEFLENFGLLVTYVSKYPRIRLANPKLSQMGPGAMIILRTCGFTEKEGFLVKNIENEKIVEKSREILEVLTLEFETGVTLVKKKTNF